MVPSCFMRVGAASDPFQELCWIVRAAQAVLQSLEDHDDLREAGAGLRLGLEAGFQQRLKVAPPPKHNLLESLSSTSLMAMTTI